jgi:hypothetical protein
MYAPVYKTVWAILSRGASFCSVALQKSDTSKQLDSKQHKYLLPKQAANGFINQESWLALA